MTDTAKRTSTTLVDATSAMPGEPGGSLRRAAGSVFTPRNTVVGAAVAVILYLAGMPLVFLLKYTFIDNNGSITLDSFRRAFSENSLGASLFVNSLEYSAGSAAFAVILGGILAYLYVRTDTPLKPLLFASAVGPIIVPGVLYAIAWTFLGDKNVGLLNHNFFEPLFGVSPVNIYRMWGMILVQGLHHIPIAFFFMMAAFRGMDPSVEESAAMCGASRFTVLRRVTIPLLRPAILGGALIIFVQSIEGFEIPAVVGLPANIRVFTSEIYTLAHTPSPDYGEIGAFAMVLVVVAMLGVFSSGFLTRNLANFQTITGKGFRARPIRLSPAAKTGAVALTVLYFVVGLLLPVGILVYASLLPFYTDPSFQALHNMSLDNYRHMLDLPSATNGLRISLELGAGAATGVILLTATAGWFVARTRSRGRRVVDAIAFTPIVIPGLVLGLSIVFVYLRSPVPIYGTIWILLIAYATRYIPYGMRYSVAAMSQMSSELEECASVCGASWTRTFRRVLLPLASGGLLAGWVYIFVVSFRELSASVLLASPQTQPFAVVIWSQFESGNLTLVAAMAVVMVAVLLVLVTISNRISKRFGVRESGV